MKRCRKTLCGGLLLVMMCISSGYGQTGPTVSHSFLNNSALDVFFLKDFDINSPGSGPPIFFIDIMNDGVVRNVIMRLSITSRRRGNLSRGQTGIFSLQPGQILKLSSRDIFSNSGPYRLESYQIDDEAAKSLIKDVLSTGKLPSDVYTFQVILVEANNPGNQFGSDVFDIRVSNPHKLDLVFPGAPASGQLKDCPVIFTNLPQFRWESDMRQFRVVIAPLRRGDDPESALNNEPRFTRFFVLQGGGNTGLVAGGNRFNDRVEVIPNTSFQFPSSGEILTMRPGKTYVWRVIGIIETSSGSTPFKSEIYCFRLANLDKVDTGMQQLNVILKNLLGSDYEKIFGEGGELDGYLPKRITFDGKDVTAGELLVRLRKMHDKFKGYKIE